MSFAIVADLLLGTYRAGVGEGQPDPWPSPARLHAALLSTAARGLHAVDRDGHLHPSDEAIAALEWLESNPPRWTRAAHAVVEPRRDRRIPRSRAPRSQTRRDQESPQARS